MFGGGWLGGYDQRCRKLDLGIRPNLVRFVGLNNAKEFFVHLCTGVLVLVSHRAKRASPVVLPMTSQILGISLRTLQQLQNSSFLDVYAEPSARSQQFVCFLKYCAWRWMNMSIVISNLPTGAGFCPSTVWRHINWLRCKWL